MVARYDVVVVGAGILGMSTAYYLKQAQPDLSIMVVDQHPKGGMGNTAKSAALFRNVFSSPMNRLLASASLKFYHYLQKEKGVDIGLRYTGYLWLCHAELWKQFQVLRLKEDKSIAARSLPDLKFDLRDVSKETLMDMFGVNISGREVNVGENKSIRLPDIEHGIMAPLSGTLAPGKLFGYYEKQYKELGGELLYMSRVEKIMFDRYPELDRAPQPKQRGAKNSNMEAGFGFEQAMKFNGLKTADGMIKADRICLATGTWTNQLTDPLGIDVHVKPKKRQLFNIVVKAEEAARGFVNKEERFPIFILPPDGVYVKPLRLRGSFVVGWADDLGRRFEFEEEPAPEPEHYEAYIKPVLTTYLPWLNNAELKHSWAGQYHYNTLDGNPFIFSVQNMTIVVGASGSGIMKADALGRITAAKIMGEERPRIMGDVEFPVDSLGFQNRMVIKESLML